MPGHKGQGFWDVRPETSQKPGADVLDQACGIIAESEANAAALFQTGRTFYSTEGSSLSVKAMLALAAGNAVQEGERPLILAARNVHKPFFTAVPSWIWTWNGCIRSRDRACAAVRCLPES